MSMVERRFWAGVLGSTVEKDGVPGFDVWWKGAHPILRRIGLRLGRETARHVRMGANESESLATAIAHFRQSIQAFRPPPEDLSTPRWTAFCSEIFNGVYQHRWKPPQVLAALLASRESMANDGPIEQWIREMRDFGSDWPIARHENRWEMADGRFTESRFSLAE